jgi:type II pantothenate kinase
MSAGPTLAIDAGATLLKLVVEGPTGFETRLLPSHAVDHALAWVRDRKPARIGLTGGGADALAKQLGDRAVHVTEFDAWASGAATLLAEQGGEATPPYLVVSVGTGTAAVKATADGGERVGGTALGGGTVLGLSGLLIGTRDFDEIAALAARGDRRHVDLLISEIYPDFPAEFSASNFGKPGLTREDPPNPEDLAHAIVCLVGENVGLMCGSLAAACGVSQVVYGGSTLRANPALRAIVEQMTQMRGAQPIFLEKSEFAGAVGALRQVAR